MLQLKRKFIASHGGRIVEKNHKINLEVDVKFFYEIEKMFGLEDESERGESIDLPMKTKIWWCEYLKSIEMEIVWGRERIIV